MPPFKKASSSGYGTPQPGALAEELSYYDAPKPFKNPNYKKNQGSAGRRSKNLKAIVALERERVDRIMKERWDKVKEERETLMAVDGAELGQVVEQTPVEELVSLISVEAPPSIMPQKKYCDVTGLEAKYVDPKSTLRYHNAEVYEIIKTFNPAVTQSYLTLRGQGVVLR